MMVTLSSLLLLLVSNLQTLVLGHLQGHNLETRLQQSISHLAPPLLAQRELEVTKHPLILTSNLQPILLIHL